MEEVDTSKLKAVSVFVDDETDTIYVLDRDYQLKKLVVSASDPTGYVSAKYRLVKVKGK